MQSALSRHLKNTKHLKFLTILSSVFGRKNWRLTIHLRSYQLLLRALIFIFIYFWTSPYLFRKLNFYNKLYETATSSFFFIIIIPFLTFIRFFQHVSTLFLFVVKEWPLVGFYFWKLSPKREKKELHREKEIFPAYKSTTNGKLCPLKISYKKFFF